jgi:hypothetical protein
MGQAGHVDKTGLAGKYYQERTARKGLPGQGCQDRRAKTGLP